MTSAFHSETGTAGTSVSTVLTFTGNDVARVVIQSDGTADTSWTVDGSDPEMPPGDGGGGNGALLMESGGIVTDVLSLEGRYDSTGVVVKVISSGTPAVSARAEY